MEIYLEGKDAVMNLGLEVEVDMVCGVQVHQVPTALLLASVAPTRYCLRHRGPRALYLLN